MLWSSWLLSDSALPIGGFIASMGLEAACYADFSQLRLTNNSSLATEAALQNFIEASLLSYAHLNLPVLNKLLLLISSHRSTSSDTETDIESEKTKDKETLQILLDLDQWMDAHLRSNATARRASRLQGSAFLTLLMKTREIETSLVLQPCIQAYKKSVMQHQTAGHMIVCLGLTMFQWSVPHEEALQMSLYMVARSMTSAAVRLNLCGPYSALRMMKRLETITMELLQQFKQDHSEKTEKATEWTMDQRVPLIDLVQGVHGRLYSKLFHS